MQDALQRTFYLIEWREPCAAEMCLSVSEVKDVLFEERRWNKDHPDMNVTGGPRVFHKVQIQLRPFLDIQVISSAKLDALMNTKLNRPDRNHFMPSQMRRIWAYVPLRLPAQKSPAEKNEKKT